MKFKQFINTINRAKNIAIFIHTNPDGDAIGSSSALFYYLTNKGKLVDIFTDVVPQEFDWLSIKDKIKTNYNEDIKYDLGILADCSDFERTGDFACLRKNCKNLIRLDHHRGGEELSKNDIVDISYSSTCELLAEILFIDKKHITNEIADCITYGILTDTFSFRNSNTTTRTLKMIIKLMEVGANLTRMEQLAFSSDTIEQVMLTKEIYKNMEITESGIAYSYVAYSYIGKNNCKREDMKGHSGMLRDIKGVKISFVIYEVEENKYNVSIRSKGEYSSYNVALSLNGGGHLNASGAEVEGIKLKELIENIITTCEKEIQRCQ